MRFCQLSLVCFFGAFIEMILSRFLHHLRKVITPVVTGTVVTLIGLSLVKVGLMDMAGGKWLFDNKPELFGTAQNLFLAFLVLIIVIILATTKNKFLRMGSIVIGLIVGYIMWPRSWVWSILAHCRACPL